jgi:hypothetical protein
MAYADIPHLRSTRFSTANAAKPSVAAGAGAGTGATAALTRGGDEAGTITVTTAGTPAIGVLATLTFATPYSVLPSAVSIDAGDVHSAAYEVYATVSGTALTISAAVAPTAAGQTLTLFYSVIGGA